MLPASLQAWMDMTANGLAGLAREIAACDSSLREPSGPSQPIVPPFAVVDLPDWVESVRLFRRIGRPLIGQLAPRDCPACGEARHHHLFNSFDGYPYHACETCGTWFVPLEVDYRLFAQLIEAHEEYRALESRIVRARETPARAEADRARFRSELEALEPLLAAMRGPGGSAGRGQRLLDIGCGMGYSLEVARERGIDAAGIEVEPQSIASCRSRGLDVGRNRSELRAGGGGREQRDGPGRFSVISMFETAEHLVDPAGTLAAHVELLDERGIVVMTFPNLDSPSVRILRERLSWLYGGTYTPGHINFFSRASITRLLERCGLVPLAIESVYGLNQLELQAFLTGEYGGIDDLIEGRGNTPHPSPISRQAALTLGPVLSLLERSLKIGPLLRVVAARARDVAVLQPAVESFRRSRLAEFTAQTSAVLPPAAAPIGMPPSFGGRMSTPSVR